jgi:agmatinase
MNDIINKIKLILEQPCQSDHLFMKSWLPGFMGTWDQHLDELLKHDICMFGYPCDTGSSSVKGAAEGPDAIRKALFSPPAFDLGNLRIIPQFLSDCSLNQAQIQSSRLALYGDLDKDVLDSMPVSPVEVCHELIKMILSIKPEMRFIMIGGDQSGSWATTNAIAEKHSKIGVIHFDAHNDCREHIYGIKITGGSWFNHLKNKLGSEKVIQLGVRDIQDFELDHYVINGKEILRTAPKAYSKDICNRLQNLGIDKIYLSIDISACDSSLAPACGHTIPNGLYPHHINTLIEELPKNGISIIAADLMEVAPRIGTGPGSSSTCRNAAQFLRKEIEAMKAQ